MTAEYSDFRSPIPMLMDWMGVIRFFAMLSGIIIIIIIIIMITIMMMIRIRG